jgi:hypothetical protein
MSGLNVTQDIVDLLLAELMVVGSFCDICMFRFNSYITILASSWYVYLSHVAWMDVVR